MPPKQTKNAKETPASPATHLKSEVKAKENPM
jgi:hypothetical protein